ncbi:MFS transporter [Halosegnis marinus]|uniref:Lysosomal dipeptide transporter MFSD1 n=1 Tax=Halosegnis marinus TaxID=3034023 RepID=A0ABD5ZP41_9EURY|nr:MFS transporter [Halosegnis sp. DT85]
MSLSPRRRRALLWTLLAAGFLLVNFHRTATAVLADSLARTFETDAAELGFLHASFFYIYAGLQLPAGLLVDRYGPRGVASVGLGAMTVGVVGFAFAGSFTGAFLARAVVGLGGSVLYVATLRFCAAWFSADAYATMTGLTIAAAGVGGILATTPLALAIEATGWRDAVLASAVAGAVIAVGIALFVRDRPPGGLAERVGVASDGGESSPPSLSQVVANTRHVLGEGETWLMGVTLFLVLGANFTVLGLWGVPFVVDVYGVSVATASTFVLLGNVGFVLGSPVFGALSDRLERRTSLMVGSAAVFTVAYGVLVVVPPLPVVGLVLFTVLFANGGVALAFTVAKERHEPDVAGTVTGVINSLGYFGAAVLPSVMGYVLDAYWTGEVIGGARVYTPGGYRVAFAIAAGAGVLATLCTVALHYRETASASAAT